MSISKDFIVKSGLQVQGANGTVSTNTGALQVGGGAGIAGSVFVAGTGTFGTTNPGVGSTTSVTLQTLQVKGGGFGVVGDSYINGNIGVTGVTNVTNSLASTSTNSGALTVVGGIGVGGDGYFGGQLFSQNAGVITTASLGVYGVTALFAGTDTAVSANTGTVTVWNTSTLQTITNRGSTTTNAIYVNNNTNASSTNSGALQVINGGAGIGGNIYVGGIVTGNSLSVATTAGFYSTTDATSINTGSVVIAGGLAVAKTIYALNEVIISANASISAVASNALAVTAGGLGVAGTAFIQGNTLISSTTTSANTNSGQALLVTGGVGVGGNLYASNLIASSTVKATSGGAGSLQVAGGGYFADNLVVMGTAASTGTTSSNALYVAGGAGIEGSLFVGGPVTFSSPVTFNGTATYVLSTNTFYTDNMLELHTPPGGVSVPWTVDDGKDIGLRFHYYSGADQNAALVLDATSKELHWYSSGAEDLSGNFGGTATYGIFRTGALVLTTGTVATSTLTGALQVQGGIGINGASYFAGIGGSASTSSASGQGLVIAANGLGVTGGSYFASGLGIGGAGLTVVNGANIGTVLTIAGGTASFVSTNTQGLVVGGGGIGVTGDSYVNGAVQISGITTVTNVTNATSTNTGALNVAGGLGVGKDLYVGGTVFGNLTGTVSTASNLAGGLAGGIPYQQAPGSTVFIPIGSNGSVLTSNGSTATWSALGGVAAGTATNAINVAITTTNISASYNVLFASSTTGFQTVFGDTGLTFNPNTDSLTVSGTADATSTTTGALVVSGAVGVGRSLFVGSTATILGAVKIWDATVGTNTTTGALTVAGSIGSGPIYATQLYDSGNRAVTSVVLSAGNPSIGINTVSSLGTSTSFTITNLGVTALSGTTYIGVSSSTGSVTLTNLGVQTLTAGTDTAVSASTGTIVVWNTSTLQTITDRGYTTTNLISITNTTQATTTTNGALTVAGGAGLQGNLYVGGTVVRTGNVSTSGWLANGVGFSSPSATYTDTSLTGAQATATIHSFGAPTIAATGGTPTYADAATLYIGGSPIAGSGAIITNPWSLLVGSGNVKILAGTTNNSTSSGALQVVGGAGFGGAITAGGSVTAGTAVSGAVVNGFITNNTLIATYVSTVIGTTSTQNLDTWSTSSYRTAKYMVQMVDTAFTPQRVHATEIMMFHDGAGNVYKSEYGIVTNLGELGTFDASITGGNVQLTMTPSFPTLTPSSLFVKVYRTAITS